MFKITTEYGDLVYNDAISYTKPGDKGTGTTSVTGLLTDSEITANDSDVVGNLNRPMVEFTKNIKHIQTIINEILVQKRNLDAFKIGTYIFDVNNHIIDFSPFNVSTLKFDLYYQNVKLLDDDWHISSSGDVIFEKTFIIGDELDIWIYSYELSQEFTNSFNKYHEILITDNVISRDGTSSDIQSIQMTFNYKILYNGILLPSNKYSSTGSILTINDPTVGLIEGEYIHILYNTPEREFNYIKTIDTSLSEADAISTHAYHDYVSVIYMDWFNAITDDLNGPLQIPTLYELEEMNRILNTL